jgi:uncharacterized protein (DUF488 family)
VKTLYTIGYEGASVDDFVGTLKVAGVEHILDIRELAQSRRPGFSKNALKDALSRAGIGYTHSKSLGDPKAGREAARRGDFDKFQQIFSDHLESVEAQAALMEAAQLVQKSVTGLLCYERNPKHCHRSIVATRLKDRCSLNVHHLGVRSDACDYLGSVPKAA